MHTCTLIQPPSGFRTDRYCVISCSISALSKRKNSWWCNAVITKSWWTQCCYKRARNKNKEVKSRTNGFSVFKAEGNKTTTNHKFKPSKICFFKTNNCLKERKKIVTSLIDSFAGQLFFFLLVIMISSKDTCFFGIDIFLLNIQGGWIINHIFYQFQYPWQQ